MRFGGVKVLLNGTMKPKNDSELIHKSLYLMGRGYRISLKMTSLSHQ